LRRERGRGGGGHTQRLGPPGGRGSGRTARPTCGCRGAGARAAPRAPVSLRRSIRRGAVAGPGPGASAVPTGRGVPAVAAAQGASALVTAQGGPAVAARGVPAVGARGGRAVAAGGAPGLVTAQGGP